MGVTRIDGRPLAGDYSAGIIAPAGLEGPAFLVTRNFDAVYSYNAAESYGLAIALLGDRLRGAPGIQAAWPTDDPPLSRAERRELQQRLAARGFDVGEPDGRVGQKTRDAIKSVERRIGMPPTGRPGGKVLQALRGRWSQCCMDGRHRQCGRSSCERRAPFSPCLARTPRRPTSSP